MRIVVISDWFAEKMGYSENCLPKAMAALGQDVHLVTSNTQPYFNLPMYKETYEPFLGPGVVDCVVKPWDGYTLHRLAHCSRGGMAVFDGLGEKLRALRPDIVQTFDVVSPTTVEAAHLRDELDFRLFLECHLHSSVYSRPKMPSGVWRRWRHRRAVSRDRQAVNRVIEKCYPIASDCAEIAVREFGVDPDRISIVSLGVDTQLFSPVESDEQREARQALRLRLGFDDGDVVCIYTGRFSSDKDPRCLAQAVDRLVRAGAPVKGLFVGGGSSADTEAIQRCMGCSVHPFVAVRDLPDFYRSAEIGVWPKQESTSQLDAASCGLPIVVSNRVEVTERVDGNGLLYEENDPADLAARLQSLLDPVLRTRLGSAGAEKVRRQWSWDRIAAERLREYAASVGLSRKVGRPPIACRFESKRRRTTKPGMGVIRIGRRDRSRGVAVQKALEREFEGQTTGPFNERAIEYAFVFRQLSRLYPSRILDVGTGESALPRLMRTCGSHVTAIANVKNFWPAGMQNRHYYVIDDDITNPQISGGFDLVTCISVLEHIVDFDLAVRGMFTLLSPKAHLIMTFPYTEGRFVDNVYELPDSDADGQEVPFVCRSYSRADLDRWLRDNHAVIAEQEFWRMWQGECWSEGEPVTPPCQVSRDEKHQLTCLLIRRNR